MNISQLKNVPQSAETEKSSVQNNVMITIKIQETAVPQIVRLRTIGSAPDLLVPRRNATEFVETESRKAPRRATTIQQHQK